MSHPHSVFVLPKDARARMDMLAKQHEKEAGDASRATPTQNKQPDTHDGNSQTDAAK